MKINSGELIKKMRKDMGISQTELAERLFLSGRQLSRIETGEVDMDIWQFASILELMGQPSDDFWLLYLETDEYDEYKTYKHIKRLLRDGRLNDVKKLLHDLEKKDLAKRPLISQFVMFVNVIVDKEMPMDQALDILYKAIQMSIPDFNENNVSEYRLTYNEIYIITGIAIRLNSMGERDRSINLTRSIIESRENSRVSEEDKADIFPALMANLSTMLGVTGKFKESLTCCNQALEICREYNNLRFIPNILYNIASCHRKMGEEEQTYKPYLVRAYHCAYAIGNNVVANIIKSDAEKNFGIALP